MIKGVVLAVNARVLVKNLKPFDTIFHDLPHVQLLVWTGTGEPPISFNKISTIRRYFEESGHDHSTSEVDIFYDGNEIPFDNSKFDHVFASEVFEHVFNLDELLKEINRVTKKGGSLLITLPFVWDEHEEPYDFARYSSFGITDILKKHGYTVINLHKSTSYIGTIFQMFAAYISQVILPENRFIRIALTPFCVAPFNIIGIFLSYILPDNRKFYLNNIVYSIKD